MKSIFSSTREAIRGKVIQLIAWTVTFTTIFTSYANKGFSFVANRNNDTFYTYNRTLDSNGIIILAIPAVILAIIVMTAWLKANRRVIALPMARKIGLSRFIETGGISDSRIIGFISFFGKGVKIPFTRVAKTGGSGNSNSHNSSGSNGNSVGRYAAYSDSLKKSSNRSDDNRKADEEARVQAELKQKKANDDDKARFEAKLKQDHATFLRNEAIKQDRINSENIHAQTRRNYALNAQNEANQAKRDLRK